MYLTDDQINEIRTTFQSKVRKHELQDEEDLAPTTRVLFRPSPPEAPVGSWRECTTIEMRFLDKDRVDSPDYSTFKTVEVHLKKGIQEPFFTFPRRVNSARGFNTIRCFLNAVRKVIGET